MSGMVGERCAARFASRLDCSAPHLRQRNGSLGDHNVKDLARDQVRHGGTSTAVGDQLKARISQLLQQQAGDLRCCGNVGELCFPRVRLHPGDQFLEIVCWKILASDHELRIYGHKPDRLEIFL